MQITRAKATALLNKGEMTLYDESRHNAIRGFTAAQLESRITRARSSRDRSRDLVRRQKLSSRASTGSKRGTSGAANQRSQDKAEIMADILKRFETRLKEAKKLEKEEAAAARSRAAPARKAVGTKKTARRSDRREGRKAVRTEVKAAGPAKQATKKVAKKAAKKTTKAAKSATSKAAKSSTKKATGTATGAASKATEKTTGRATEKAAGKAARKQGAKKPAAKKVTPKQALRSTRKVLEAKQEQARQPKPWEEATAHGGQVGADGFQSTEAARRAEELQAAGSRMPAIHGSAGTRGRINQGKRDSKDGH